MFNKEFREAEERAMRIGEQVGVAARADARAVVHGVGDADVARACPIARRDGASRWPSSPATHQAMVLEKLVQPAEEEEEIPSGV